MEDGYGKIIKTISFAEINNYQTKHEFYNMINLAEKVKRQLEFELSKINYKDNPYFNFDEEEPYFLDDIYVVNKVLPKETLTNNIILVSNVDNENLKRLLKTSIYSKIYVFSDEKSLFKFKDCLLNSKNFFRIWF